MIGQEINSFTILEELTIPSNPYFEDVPHYKLKCKCGNIRTHKTLDIINNIIKSCGDHDPNKPFVMIPQGTGYNNKAFR